MPPPLRKKRRTLTHNEIQKSLDRNNPHVNVTSHILWKIERSLEEEFNERRVIIQKELASFPKEIAVVFNPFKRGIEIYRAVQEDLARLDKWYPRSTQQKEMHEIVLNACIPQIFGPIYESNKDLIMKELNITAIHSEVVFLWPRRFGKSTALSGFEAGYLRNVPDADSCIYSIAQRTSYALLCKIGSMIHKLSDEDGIDCIKKFNQETLQIVNRSGHLSTCKSYPDSDKNRGTGGKLIILEEAAFMNRKKLSDIIFPLLMMKDVVVVLITSMDSPTGFMNRLVNTKYDDGNPVFFVSRVELVCDSCKKAGLLKECIHKLSELPPWLSKAQYDKLDKIQTGHGADFVRETKGVQTDPSIRHIFGEDRLKILRKDDRWTVPVTFVDKIFITVDPAGGGLNSDYAIVSCFYEHGKMVIVGLDILPHSQGIIQFELLESHIIKLRSVSIFKNATIYLEIESNYGNEAVHHQAHFKIKNIRNLVIMKDDQRSSGLLGCGIRVDNGIKRSMAMSFSGYLNAGNIYFYKNMVVCNPKMNAKIMTEKLIEQLENYTCKVTEFPGTTRKPKEEYSGKDYGPDDLAVSVQLNTIAFHMYYLCPQRYDNDILK